MNQTSALEFAVVMTRHGELFIPSTDTVIGKSLRLYGEWAERELAQLTAFITQGSTVVDVGACFGTHALAFAHATGSTGRVFALEGSRQNAAILQRNTKIRGGYAKIEIVNAVAADQDGLFFEEQLSGENSGATHFAVRHGENAGTGIRSVTLDSLELDNVSLLKLDVEGMEAVALSGAGALLDRNRPVIFSEVNTLQDGNSVMRVLAPRDFRYFATISTAFNPDNLNGETRDIFEGAAEVGLFSIPAERVSYYEDQITQHGLVQIETIDDLLKVLMVKPQYALDLLMSSDLQPSLRKLSIPAWQGELTALEGRLAQSQLTIQKLLETHQKLSDQVREYCHWSEQTEKYSEQLQRSASKLPFALYYKNKKKYLNAFKGLKEAREKKGAIHFDPNLAPGPVLPTAPEQNHPAGYKAAILAHLQPMSMEEAPQPSEHPQLSASDLLSKTSSDRGLILSFSHDNYLEVVGGTQLCVGLEQRAADEAGFDYVHLYPLIPMQGMAAQGNRSAAFLGLSLNGQALGATSYQALIDFVSARTGKTRIVLHQLLGHVAENIAEVVRASGDDAPIFWLHDFFILCQSQHLLRNRVTFCGAPQPDSMACGICSFGAVRPRHQDRMAQLLGVAPFQLVAPSEFVAELIREKLSLPYGALTVQPHMRLDTVPATETPPDNTGRLRIAYVGTVADHKGWPNFLKAVETFYKKAKYDFYYFGVHEVPPGITAVKVSTSRSDPEAMIRALRENQIDLVVHISPTPETFSLTAHEALAAGAFIVTNRMSGNTARLVEQSGRGCVLERESDLLTAFEDHRIAHLAEAAQQRRATSRDVAVYSRLSMTLIAPKDLN